MVNKTGKAPSSPDPNPAPATDSVLAPKGPKFMPSFAAIPSPGRHAAAPDGRRDSQALDPISQTILNRNTPSSATRAGSSANLAGREDTRSARGHSTARERSASTSRDRRHTFLSRLVPPKKRASAERPLASPLPLDPEPSPPIGFVPQFPRPARYLKTKVHGKKEKEFTRLFVAQELRGRTGAEIAQAGGRPLVNGLPLPDAFDGKKKNDSAVWAMEFSKDGRFLAAGGKDYVVRVWAVLTTPEERHQYEVEDETTPASHLVAPVFRRKTVQEYAAHTANILDLSWSKNNFLLSSSMDKTVRLWHASREECLCCFKHSDFVTSIQFHPRDDRFFLAGSLDSKLRLWSIPDKSVAYWAALPELITAVAFTPDGNTAIAGCLNGICNFYDTESLKYASQLHVRSAHGKFAKGSKITGIQTMADGSNPGITKILVTSNDSRIRVFNLPDKGLSLKLKGNENFISQIQASFSDDSRYIICGSEDKRTYIWPTDSPELERDKRPAESFEAHQAIVTKALLAPAKTRQILSASADPVYDLCNPPPVTLVSRRNSLSSDSRRAETNDGAVSEKPKPAAYLARCLHPDGQIIVSADVLGNIRVLRQDCAYESRLRINSDSTLTKRILGRTGSMATKTSGNSSQHTFHAPSDRILSWRQSIEHGRTHSASHESRKGPVRGRSPTKTRPSSSNTDAAMAKLTANSTTDFSAWDMKEENPLMLRGGQSYMYWNQQVYRAQMAHAGEDESPLASPGIESTRLAPPPLHREITAASILSSEDDSEKPKPAVGEEMRCKSCRSTAFRVRIEGSKQQLMCGSCGVVA